MMVVSAVILYMSITMKRFDVTDPAGGSFLPAVISLIMLAAAVTTLIKTWRTAKLEKDASEVTNTKVNEPSLKLNVTVFYYLLIIIGFVIILPYLSFIYAALIFLVGSMLFLKNISIVKNLIISICTVFVFYVIFQQFFNIVLP